VAVPVRTPWREDVPGALVALLVLVVGSALLRVYLVHSVEGPTVYGSLAAPVAVLLWIGVTALAVLIGAAMNASIDRLWPSKETAEARARADSAREVAAAEVVRIARERREAAEQIPAEYPERWVESLPPTDLGGGRTNREE
jgi:membrane protein